MKTEPQQIPLTEKHQALLESRGIQAELAVKLGWKTLEGRSGDWVAIPFLRAGKAVNHKFRTISGEKRFSQDKGGEQCFYNLEVCESAVKHSAEYQRALEIVITEGEMDCLAALQCGYMAISVPNGANEKPIDSEDSVKFDYLKDFPQMCIAVLAVDDDPAGRVLRQELALRLGWHRCKFVQFPKGCKDLNEIYQKYGQKGVDKVLKEKSSFINKSGLFRMSELPAQAELPAYECGIGELSSMIKIRPGDFIVITGIPSMGKSLFVNALSANIASIFGWNICIASFEVDPRGGIQKYLRTFFLEKPNGTEAGWNLWSDSEIAQADEWINRRYSFILPDLESDEMTTLKWLLERVRAAITQHGVRMMIIDPWNEIDHDRPNGMSLTEYVGFAIKEIKRLGKRYMCTIIIVAHPSKMEKTKDGTYGVPTLYDISDSSHWYNKADIGIIVHRMEGEDGGYATLVRVAKIREWGVMGRIGDRYLEYSPLDGRYQDAPDFVAKRPKQSVKAPMDKPEKPLKPTPQMALQYKDD